MSFSTVKRDIRYFLPITVAALLLFSFQNCGQVKISENQSKPLVAAGIRGQFCVSKTAGSKYVKTKLYFLNLTAKPVGHRLLADTDVDGLEDSLEAVPGSLFSPSDRRSGGILDSICYRRGLGTTCPPSPGSCDPNKKFFFGGISECDVAAFNGNGGPKGLNTDGNTKMDFIPDFIEVLRGTSVASEDSDISADRDALSNEQEIILGSDPNDELSFSPPMENRALIELSLDEVPNAACNGQDSYSFNVSQFPTIPLEPYPDSDGIAHSRDENLGMIVLVSRNIVTSNVQYHSYMFRIVHNSGMNDILVRPEDFVLEGQY